MAKRKLSKRIKYNVLVVFIKALIFCAGLLPRKLIVYSYSILGRIAYLFFKDTRKQILKNLTIALGKEKSQKELKAIIPKMFVNLSKNVADILYGLSIKKFDRLEKFIKTDGFEHFDNAYKKGNGVIILTCHMGAFEFTATYPALRGYDVNVVGTEMKDPRLDKMLVENRTSRGAKNVHRGKDTIKLMRALKNGEALVILIDQDTKVKSVFADFFGKLAYTPIGATMLALKTNASVVPVAIRRMPDENHLMTFLPEIELTKSGDYEKDLVDNTQVFNNALEKLIRQDLTQWVWMHERWKTRPESE